MLTDKLFKRVLLEPAQELGVDRLQIVSGFATANMAYRHLEKLSSAPRGIDIELIVGMAPKEGIALPNHRRFVEMAEEGASQGHSFSCRYAAGERAIHAKLYCWLQGGKPIKAFGGSANYTMTGFGEEQGEIMVAVDPAKAHEFFNETAKCSNNCLSPDIETLGLLKEPDRLIPKPVGCETVKLSLLTKNEEMPSRSGLNWGQRNKRNRNQAYINIPKAILDLGFFPERGKEFKVITDDGEAFTLTRCQDEGKGLHTRDNSLLGRYFRVRLKLKSGAFVTKEDLLRYGRTYVTFTQIAEDTYFMDFSN